MSGKTEETKAVGTEMNGGSLSPPSPAERSRLTKCFTTGSDNLRKGNYDYAVELFGSCVAGDPGSAIYLQGFLEALSKKYSGKKKGGLASLLSAGSRGSLKRLLAGGKTREAIKTGLAILKKNPFDIACILTLAETCGSVNCLDTQGLFLRQALDVAPKDIAVNRHCANYKERLGEYDQAISCWQRLAGTKSVREEAEREIARLSVEKTREKLESRGLSSKEDSGVDPLEQLQKKLAASPTDSETAFELADLLEREASIEEAEKVLVNILAASGNDLKVREHLEDRQIRWAKRKVMLAEKQVQTTDSKGNRETLDRLRTALVKQEIDIFAARVERYPDNVAWKFELAIRLKTAGSPAEAIKYFQQVQIDSRRRGAVALELGECFQKIKQYPLAMRNYQTAVESLGDREIELRKRALYRAGVLAAAMKDRDAALKFLSNVAEIDFAYRDVAQRLEKLNAEDA